MISQLCAAPTISLSVFFFSTCFSSSANWFGASSSVDDCSPIRPQLLVKVSLGEAIPPFKVDYFFSCEVRITTSSHFRFDFAQVFVEISRRPQKLFQLIRSKNIERFLYSVIVQVPSSIIRIIPL